MTSWVEDIEGEFPLHGAVVEAMPDGAKATASESWGISAWTQTAKVTVTLPDGTEERYFLKCGTGKTAENAMWGEWESAKALREAVPNFCPEPIGKGQYYDDMNGEQTWFYLQRFHDLDENNPPDPADLAELLAELHTKGRSPNGMFGFTISTGGGVLNRTVTWEKSWAKQFTHQLNDVIKLDQAANEPWPEFDAACAQLVDKVVPRLLGILQEDGRTLEPSLVHMDLWEGNVATDEETGKVITFDPGSVYAHNEAEFGGWRCSWATHFSDPIYQTLYQQLVEPSDPREEWDDRNRLYAIRAALCDSAGHPGNSSRGIAYNDMLFLCEKFAPLDTLEAYDASKDISVTGIREEYDVLKGAKLQSTDKSVPAKDEALNEQLGGLALDQKKEISAS